MVFYAAAYRHVPVNWIVAFLNIFSMAFGIVSWTGERFWSFLNALWYNLIGFDKYFIFMDHSPIPIPYWYFGGNPSNQAWLYDARNKTFTYCVDEGLNKKEHLPVLAMTLHTKYRGQTHDEMDMSSWLENVTFYTHDEHFPHPLQLLSAWSLETRFWPATKYNSNTYLETINAQTADVEIISLIQIVEPHKWYDYAADSDVDEEEEEGVESELSHDEEEVEVGTEEEEGADYNTKQSESLHEEEEEAESESPHEEEVDNLVQLPESPPTEEDTPPNSVASDDYVRDMEAVD